MAAKPPIEDIKWAQRVIGTHDDGNFGNGSLGALITFLRLHNFTDEAPTSPGTPDAIHVARARIVAWCVSHLTGPGHTSGELDPVTEVWPYVCPAFAVPELRHKKSWCGGWALCAWKFNLLKCGAWVWRDQVGFLSPYGVKTASLPEPGDIRVSKYAENSSDVVWHYSIVRRVRGDGKVDTIDGNTMAYPKEGVTARTVPLVREGVTYYSAAAYL